MSTLDELLNIDGDVAAGEVTSDGKLVDYRAKMDMSQDMAEKTAQFCATVTMMFNTLAGAFAQLSQMNWVPQQGWAYSGGDFTAAIGGNQGVFTIEVTEYEPNKKFGVKTISGPIQGETTMTLLPVADGTRVTQRIEKDVGTAFKLAEPLVARVFKRYFESDLATLKDLVEAQA